MNLLDRFRSRPGGVEGITGFSEERVRELTMLATCPAEHVQFDPATRRFTGPEPISSDRHTSFCSDTDMMVVALAYLSHGCRLLELFDLCDVGATYRPSKRATRIATMSSMLGVILNAIATNIQKNLIHRFRAERLGPDAFGPTENAPDLATARLALVSTPIYAAGSVENVPRMEALSQSGKYWNCFKTDLAVTPAGLCVFNGPVVPASVDDLTLFAFHSDEVRRWVGEGCVIGGPAYDAPGVLLPNMLLSATKSEGNNQDTPEAQRLAEIAEAGSIAGAYCDKLKALFPRFGGGWSGSRVHLPEWLSVAIAITNYCVLRDPLRGDARTDYDTPAQERDSQ